MLFKVYYQATKVRNPKREDTLSLYVEAASESEARIMVEQNTDHNIEFIEQLDDATAAYEKQNPNFQVTTF
ncbi:DNA-directed RNA polymerase subunit epsilon [Paucilactobacillus sp. N302-9]